MKRKTPKKIARGAQMLRLLPAEHAAYKQAAAADRRPWSTWARLALNDKVDALRASGVIPKSA